ncbi:aminotransferase class IV [Desulfocicer vacuolatum]|uniref:aminotransferase class IV n=1 Tax=Desulfocicer vacuolatum TaxID=2298 RepID=UPI001E31202D|nr:aminotransferase class IV [Desulfocicer vacuolatum]
MDKKNIYYVNGKFVEADKAVIPVDDLAVLRGLGVCDLMRTFNGMPCFLEEHIARLETSAEKIGLTLPWSGETIEKIVLETLERNSDMDNANIRIIITGGSSSDFMTPRGEPRLIILVTPMPSIPAHWYTHGVKVITTLSQRSIPGAKSISYISASLALKKAREQNAMEALLMDRDGNIPEGTTSNLFAFIDNILVTADTGVLEGITRKVILSLAEPLFPIEFRTLHIDELLNAREVFISGTNKGVVPVVQINDTVVGNGKPGKNTRKIINAMENHSPELSCGG